MEVLETVVGAKQTIDHLKSQIEWHKEIIQKLHKELAQKDISTKKQIAKIKKLNAQKIIENEGAITKGQKMVLLDFIGALDAISIKFVEPRNIKKVLSFFIQANYKNVEKDFNNRSKLLNTSNCAFMVQLFDELKMFKERDEYQIKLNALRKKQRK